MARLGSKLPIHCLYVMIAVLLCPVDALPLAAQEW